jgi:hypothetical protein
MPQPKTNQVKSLLARALTKEQMLDMVATGWTLRKIADHVTGLTNVPVSAYYVCKALQQWPDEYGQAKKAQAEMHAERVASIADDVEAGRLDPASARVASDNRKWVASKLDPSTYSDKAMIDVRVTDVAEMHLIALRERLKTVSNQQSEDARLLAATD